MTRVLRTIDPSDSKDVEDIRELWATRRGLLERLGDSGFEEQLSRVGNSHYVFVDDGVMTCSLSAMFLKFSPATLLGLMVSRPESEGLGFNNASLRELIQEVMKIEEASGVHTFYSVRRVEEFRIQSRRNLWPGWDNSRYTGYTECYVPKGTLPRHSMFAQFYGNKPLAYDTLVRSQHLRDKYRFVDHPLYVDPNRYED